MNAEDMSKKELLNSFVRYWKNSHHQNVEDAVRGFLKTKNNGGDVELDVLGKHLGWNLRLVRDMDTDVVVLPIGTLLVVSRIDIEDGEVSLSLSPDQDLVVETSRSDVKDMNSTRVPALKRVLKMWDEQPGSFRKQKDRSHFRGDVIYKCKKKNAMRWDYYQHVLTGCGEDTYYSREKYEGMLAEMGADSKAMKEQTTKRREAREELLSVSVNELRRLVVPVARKRRKK